MDEFTLEQWKELEKEGHKIMESGTFRHDWFASAALGYKHCSKCPAKWMSQDDPEPIGCFSP